MVRCMLIHSKLSITLWAKASSVAFYNVNISPSTGINFKTPYELQYAKLVDYSNMEVFGCSTYAHIRQEKLEPRALRCVFLSYADGVKGYKLQCTDIKPPRAIISRDVVLNESEMLQHSTLLKSTNTQKIDKGKKTYLEVELPDLSLKHKPRAETRTKVDTETSK